MQVQMGVSIPAGGGEAERAEALELRVDFCAQRLGERRLEGVAQAGFRRRRGEFPLRIRECGNLRGAPGAEREVQAHAERWVPPGDAGRFVRGGFIHHEAGLGEETGLEGALDRFIDLRAAAKIVGGEDELFQSAGGICILRAPTMTTRLILAPASRV